MTYSTAPESIPISALNALEYCPRRFYYQFVQGDTLVNEYVLEGTLLHQRVHQEGERTTVEGEQTITRLYLYSETLRIAGFTDVIEEKEGVFIPVEYKHGKQGRWLNDAVQLCAQALCLEERQPDRPSIAYGYIFYQGSHRRVRVMLTVELRERTLAAIAHAFQVASLETPPQPLSGEDVVRCPGCSLLPLCLPDEVLLLQSRKGGSHVNVVSQ
ncbi:MAG: CRISPR-associated protein Cas4 [Ktedonobacteraceae bacterium]